MDSGKKEKQIKILFLEYVKLAVEKCTDKKENQIFLIYKEIQNGAVAKSFITNGLLIQFMGKYI